MAAVRLLIMIGLFLFVVVGFLNLMPFVGAAIPGFLPIFGLLMVAAGVILGFRPGGILRKERVIDDWSLLIDNACVENGHRRADEFFNDITLLLNASETPHLKIESEDLSPTLLRSIFGDQRHFIVLTDTTNYRLRAYRMFISARQYGVNLSTEWQLTFKPNMLLSMLSLIPFVNVLPEAIHDLDLFDQQDLRAYTANAHHCTISAVTKILEELNQDPASIDKKSSGFVGVH